MSETQKILENIIDKAIDTTKESYQNPLVSYENYKKGLKEQAIEAINEYSEHIQHGYEVILERLRTQNKKT